MTTKADIVASIAQSLDNLVDQDGFVACLIFIPTNEDTLSGKTPHTTSLQMWGCGLDSSYVGAFLSQGTLGRCLEQVRQEFLEGEDVTKH